MFQRSCEAEHMSFSHYIMVVNINVFIDSYPVINSIYLPVTLRLHATSQAPSP
jgi:hypothetical protein